MIICDYSGIAISNIFTQREALSENLIRHQILNSLRMYNVKFRGEYGPMVLACDGGNTWRKQLWPLYKANRKKNREEGGLDWPEFFRILNLVREEIRENLPFKVIHIQGLEADDVIASLVESTQEFGKHEPVMIVSSDKDFIQLHRHGNVRQYSPMAKAFVREKDPVAYLREHILRGDGGDGIPNVLSADDVFVTGTRQTPVSSKKIDAWLKSWDSIESILDENTLRNFRRNQALIDLSRIPEDKKAQVINTFESTPVRSNVLQYLISKRCSHLIECAAEFSSHEITNQ